MAPYKIIGIKDRYDPRITEFRKNVCIENGADPDYLEMDIDHDETRDYVSQLNRPTVLEEIWKYGNNKWGRTEFTQLECVLHEDKIVGIAGSRLYANKMLRVGMHHYTLMSYRKDYRNLLFSEKGYFYHQLQLGKSMGNVDCLFLTIYPHNHKLETLTKNIAHRRISPDGGKENLYFVDKFIFLEEKIRFHDVDQYFFLYPINDKFKFNGMAPKLL